MTLLQKIRTSFSTQLSLWVAGFVLIISGVVIFLLTRFSEDVIRDESIDTTMQALENTALRIDNTLRQTEMMARLEHLQLRVNRSRIEQLIEENGLLATLQHTLPHAQLYVTRRDSSHFDFYITGGASGYRQLKHDNEEIYIFSQPLGQRSFCLVAVSPADDIYSRYGRMQQSLAQSVSDIRLANDELEQHNDELASAYQFKQNTNRRKAAFIQDMYHKIRTPLNIISGFAQVLSTSFHVLPDDEVYDITNRMHESAQDISRLTRQLEEAVSPDPKSI